MFRHPNYYKELRKLRNKLDQAISEQASTEVSSVRPGPGLKQQAASDKLQAPSSKILKQQATSIKLQGTSVKLKATSNKLLDPGPSKKFQAP